MIAEGKEAAPKAVAPEAAAWAPVEEAGDCHRKMERYQKKVYSM